MCIRDWLTDAARGLNFEQLKREGVALVIILPVPHWALARFARESLSTSPELAACVFADERAVAFNALGCTFKFSTAKLKPDTIHAHTSVARAALGGLGEGLRGGGPQGDLRQMGGAWILTNDGKTAIWAHKDEFNADQVPIPALLNAAGLNETVLYSHHARKLKA